ncbi:hypothetical protein [Sphingomonas sp. TREG-RG-20F-R18-01]|uniref:hypothetical protein n=1 Tax=Sphingomonas sp. TREG-RG-20F-R18-01 TaxID=2914982 RepID=UPI001F5A76AA|nr:hypothetical protein [Sphingomonas sp. TREG-RG-20F-R18-01]
MTEPFKLRVLYALTDVLKTITPAAGYTFDMSDVDRGDGVSVPRVYRGRLWFGDDDPIPMISVVEGVAPGELVEEPPEDTPTAEYDWNLLIQGFVDDDPQHPTDPAYRLMADVRRRLVLERRRTVGMGDKAILGFSGGANNILDLRIRPGVVRPADDVSAKAYFWCNLILRITDNAAKPNE